MPRRMMRSPAAKLRSLSGSAIASSSARSRSANRLNRLRVSTRSSPFAMGATLQVELACSEIDGLGERGERLDRVAEDLHRHSSPHRERDLADPLARFRADREAADENPPLAVGEELHESRPLRVLERRRPRDLVDAPLARGHALAARVTDGCHLGIGEDGGRDRIVVRDAFLAGEVRRGDAALILADVCELRDTGHVAGRPDVLTGHEPLVHRDASPAHLHVQVLEPEAFDVRLSACGDHEVRRLERLPAFQVEAVRARPSFHAFRPHVEAKLDPLFTEGIAEEVARVPVDPGENVVPALHDRDVRSQARVELGELAPDGSSADDDQALRHIVRGRALATRPGLDVLEALDRRHRRYRPCRDHDLVALELLPVHLEPAGGGDDSAAPDDLSVQALDPLDLARVVLPGVLVAPPEDPFRVDRRGDTVCRARSEGDLDGTKERLRGDAGPVGALAADELRLDERDADLLVETSEGGDERFPARTSSEDDDVASHQCGKWSTETASRAISRSGWAAMKLPMVTTTARKTDVESAASRGGEPPAGATFIRAGWKYIALTTPR